MKKEQISVFDIFKIGIGPSSSHTIGPWRAAQQFLDLLTPLLQSKNQIREINISLFGSLAKTGKGHGTDIAVILGLSGYDPVTIDPALITSIIRATNTSNQLLLHGIYPLPFHPATNIDFRMFESLPLHPNALTFSAVFADGKFVSETYYSIGGGFVIKEFEEAGEIIQKQIPYPVDYAEDLIKWTNLTGKNISDVVMVNEETWRDAPTIRVELLHIWEVMKESVYKGCQTSGTLPGGLNVKRRASEISRNLLQGESHNNCDEWFRLIKQKSSGFKYTLDWVTCFALAVNEENASYGRVVTSPTNGSSGVIPAVLMYYLLFCNGSEELIVKFLLTAAEIGSIFKKGSTISAAMGGCQAEIGVSSAMAAAGLTECLGGTPAQCLMASEIAMKHHLGLTCDPIGGLVQIPCIERNSMGAIKAITAAQLALRSDPAAAKVSLDNVIKTMWQTAQDMHSHYKETSEGGLALHIPISLSEC